MDAFLSQSHWMKYLRTALPASFLLYPIHAQAVSNFTGKDSVDFAIASICAGCQALGVIAVRSNRSVLSAV